MFPWASLSTLETIEINESNWKLIQLRNQSRPIRSQQSTEFNSDRYNLLDCNQHFGLMELNGKNVEIDIEMSRKEVLQVECRITWHDKRGIEIFLKKYHTRTWPYTVYIYSTQTKSDDLHIILPVCWQSVRIRVRSGSFHLQNTNKREQMRIISIQNATHTLPWLFLIK